MESIMLRLTSCIALSIALIVIICLSSDDDDTIIIISISSLHVYRPRRQHDVTVTEVPVRQWRLPQDLLHHNDSRITHLDG